MMASDATLNFKGVCFSVMENYIDDGTHGNSHSQATVHLCTCIVHILTTVCRVRLATPIYIAWLINEHIRFKQASASTVITRSSGSIHSHCRLNDTNTCYNAVKFIFCQFNQVWGQRMKANCKVKTIKVSLSVLRSCMIWTRGRETLWKEKLQKSKNISSKSETTCSLKVIARTKSDYACMCEPGNGYDNVNMELLATTDRLLVVLSAGKRQWELHNQGVLNWLWRIYKHMYIYIYTFIHNARQPGAQITCLALQLGNKVNMHYSMVVRNWHCRTSSWRSCKQWGWGIWGTLGCDKNEQDEKWWH